jgi:haloalkane dehalogenase
MDWIDREAWPWEPRYADVGEGRLHYVDVGDGPPVVLAHGTPTWGFEWRHVIRALSPRYRVIVPDHLGFGLSDRPRDAGYRPEDHARRFRRFVDGLGLDRYALVVHDFGGPFALPAALDDPSRVAALVVTNSFLWGLADDPDFRWPARLAGTALFRLLYGYANLSVRVIAPSAWGDRAKLTPAIQAQYLAPWPDVDGRQRVLWALASSMTRSTAFFEAQRALLPRVAHVPTLLAWGMKDSAFRPTVLARWRTLVPHAEVVELADAGHWPHEEEPERFSAALLAFLDQNFAAIRTPSVSTLPP